MKKNSKSTKIKLFLLGRGLLVMLTSLIFFFMSPSISFAPTKIIDDSGFAKTKAINFAEKQMMSDEELSNTNAQAFFSLAQTSNQYGSQNVITLNLGARVDVLAHVDSFKIGYYYNSSSPEPWGWDYNVTNFFFGGSNQHTSTSVEPLVLKGLFLQVGFDNISNATTRKLNYIDFGTMSASGPVTGSLRMLNALVSNAGTGQNNGVLLRQTAAGRQTIIFADEPMTFLFAAKYSYTDNGGATTSNLRGFFQKIPTQSTKLGYDNN
jgi:hypothetical protein